MRPTISQYAISLEELSLGATPEVISLIAKNFFGLLKRRGEGEKMNAILKYLEKIDASKEGRIAVTAILAHEADTETKKNLSVQAKNIFSHKEVDLRYVINTEVIGGVAFRTDEVLYDATLSTEVNSLKKSFLKV